jgi:uncharacterized protein YkwD
MVSTSLVRLVLCVLACALVTATNGRAAKLTDTIDITALDQVLLSRAIFEATNRVRVAEKLKPFRPEPKLDSAADTQAGVGSIFRPPSHTNPFPLIATPLDRVKFAGLEPRYVAENIALLAVYAMPDGALLYRMKGESVLRDSRTGDAVRRHSYQSFAPAIVKAWMDSPGHRANILNPKLQYLGCAVRPTSSKDDVEMIYAVQEFYSPKR